MPLQGSKLSHFKTSSISKKFSVTKIQIFSFRKEKCSSVWSYDKKSVSFDKNVPLKILPLFLNTLFHTPVPLRERTEQEVFSSIPGNGSIMRSVLSDVFVHLVKTYFLQLLFTIFLYLFDDFFSLLKVSACVKKRSQINIR